MSSITIEVDFDPSDYNLVERGKDYDLPTGKRTLKGLEEILSKRRANFSIKEIEILDITIEILEKYSEAELRARGRNT